MNENTDFNQSIWHPCGCNLGMMMYDTLSVETQEIETVKVKGCRAALIDKYTSWLVIIELELVKPRDGGNIELFITLVPKVLY